MKKFYCSILKTANLALAGLLAILGFSTSCEGQADEYGAPYAKYSIKGKVTNSENESISGIRVRTIPKEFADLNFSDLNYPERYSTLTDSNGDYSVHIEYMNADTFKIFVEDIDGIENGSYQSDSTVLDKNEIKLSGGKGWYLGEGSKTIDFVLEKKETED